MTATNKSKTTFMIASIGFVFGFLSMMLIHFIGIKDENAHYHANFALYVNDVQDKFDNFTFYEEVQTCSGSENNPRARAHMHDNKSSLVHVHEPSVTWGHFFANLGYGIGNNYVKTDKGVYVDRSGGSRLRFVLNDKEATDIANQVIGNGDRLLIDYGKSVQSEIDGRYSAIPETAAIYNNSSDPSTCGGSKPLTITDKLKKSIGLQ